MPANKSDEHKIPYDALPPAALREVARAMAEGIRAYGIDNWLEDGGLERRRLYGATLRHIEAHRAGEQCDPESGLNHLAHAGATILMLLHLDQIGRPVEDSTSRLQVPLTAPPKSR